MGFHANPSDIEISIELVVLLNYIDLIIADFFIEDPFSAHKNAHFISLLNGYICQPLMALYDVSASSVEIINRAFISFTNHLM